MRLRGSWAGGAGDLAEPAREVLAADGVGGARGQSFYKAALEYARIRREGVNGISTDVVRCPAARWPRTPLPLNLVHLFIRPGPVPGPRRRTSAPAFPCCCGPGGGRSLAKELAAC
jgi:hypothetical protein